MRIALFADIHGNVDALDAVLADVGRSGGADRHLCLGDLVAFGPDAVAVIDRLRTVPELLCIRGNTDRWVVTGEAPLPPPDRRTDDGLLGLARLSRACGWAAGQLAAAGHLGWLASLPRELGLDLPGGRRLLAVHGAPGSDMEGVGADTGAERLAEHARSSRADVVLAGHTHVAFDGVAGSTSFHVLASASNPKGADLRACWTLLEATPEGIRFARRAVDYDTAGLLRRAREQGHPVLPSLERTFSLR